MKAVASSKSVDLMLKAFMKRGRRVEAEDRIVLVGEGHLRGMYESHVTTYDKYNIFLQLLVANLWFAPRSWIMMTQIGRKPNNHQTRSIHHGRCRKRKPPPLNPV